MSPGPPNRALKPTVPFVTGLAGAATLDDVSPIRAEPVYHGRLVKQVPRRTAGGPTAPGGRAGGLALALGGPRFYLLEVHPVYSRRRHSTRKFTGPIQQRATRSSQSPNQSL